MRLAAVLLAALTLISQPTATSAQDMARWVVVGQHAFEPGEDRATIFIERGGGRIARLRVEATHGAVYVEALRIIYDTGNSETLRLGIDLRPGAGSAVYDLAGYGRRVEAVEILGQAGAGRGGRALVRIYGEAVDLGRARGEDRAFREVAPRLAGPQWTGSEPALLDRQRIDLSHDQHILRVGPEAVEVAAIRVRVRDGSPFIRSLLIMTPSGDSREQRVGRRLRPGDATIPVPLESDGVSEVVVLIEPTDVTRMATLELEGLGSTRAMRQADRSIPPGWVLLGTGAGAARDQIPVDVGSDPVRSVALRVSDGDVVLGRISFLYSDGRRDSYPVNKEIPDGTFTPGIDLRPDARLEKVELVYTGGDQAATVEVYGRLAAR